MSTFMDGKDHEDSGHTNGSCKPSLSGTKDQATEKVTVRFVPDLCDPLVVPARTYDVSVHTTTSELALFVNSILKSVNEEHEMLNFEFLVDGELLELPLQEFLFAKRFRDEVIELEYVEAFGACYDKDLVNSPVSSQTPAPSFIKVNLADFIPKPQGMFMPNIFYQGTCLGHSLAESISSRIKYRACIKANNMVDVEIVSVQSLVSEFLDAGIIKQVGGKAKEATEYLVKKGAPLESGSRVGIKDVTKTRLTRLNDPVSDLPNQQFDLLLAKVIQERAQLCAEIAEQGPVVGLFRVGENWMHANGEVYYDRDEDYVTAVAKLADDGVYFGHAVLVYGVETPDDKMMDLILNVQDNVGEDSHDQGRAHMHISALRGYLAPVL